MIFISSSYTIRVIFNLIYILKDLKANIEIQTRGIIARRNKLAATLKLMENTEDDSSATISDSVNAPGGFNILPGYIGT